MAAALVREVATGVLVATSRRDSTNSVVIVDRGSDALLVDPAWTAAELVGLADALDGLAVTVVAGLSTHAHYDHLLWHPRFGDVPRWASTRTVEVAGTQRSRLLRDLGPDYPADVIALFGAVTPLTGDRLEPSAPWLLPWRGRRVELVGHDAHEPGSLAAWLPDVGVLVAGDLLSDVEIPLLGPAPAAASSLDAYRAGLDALADVAAHARLVIPGHGNPGSNVRARLTADRRYLDALADGRAPDDDRLADPAMRAGHLENLELLGRS